MSKARKIKKSNSNSLAEKGEQPKESKMKRCEIKGGSQEMSVMVSK